MEFYLNLSELTQKPQTDFKKNTRNNLFAGFSQEYSNYPNKPINKHQRRDFLLNRRSKCNVVKSKIYSTTLLFLQFCRLGYIQISRKASVFEKKKIVKFIQEHIKSIFPEKSTKQKMFFTKNFLELFTK